MGLPDPHASREGVPHEFLAPLLNEKPIWRGLYESIHDRVFAPKLPPLELTSTPIPVPDRMAANTNPWAVGTATLVNGGILAIVLLMGVQAVMPPSPRPGTQTKFKLDDFPLFAPRAADHGGNGGGDNDPVAANKGHLPKLDLHPLAPVHMRVLENPKLPIENSIAEPPDLKLPDNPTMTMIGVHSSPNVTLISGGPGGPAGIGSGRDGDYGPGHGPGGWGPGAGPGIYTAGVGGVSQPVPIFTPEAEFSDEARRQKYQGVCMISLIVDAQGNPQSPRVVRRLGMGLDEKAMEAVLRYRFKPAKKDGRPVAVRMTVEVNFRLY